jgi:hypothetical protein
MYDNGQWDEPKVVMYCQVGKALDMLEFSLNRAIMNTGMPKEDFDIVMICWRTSEQVYHYLRTKNLKYVDMEYDVDKDFLWNLYKGWNLGYDIGFKHAGFVCPIATDHAFYKDWLRNLFAWAKPNRIVNCKLIEPGTLPTLHSAVNLGLTLPGQFRETEFKSLCESFFKHELVTDAEAYGHRLDAMPFICPKDVWDRFGPMRQRLNEKGITGDTDFFDRCAAGGVEITKALDAISYHCGGVETRRNEPEVLAHSNVRSKVRDMVRKVIP